jgi:hypothetical protein
VNAPFGLVTRNNDAYVTIAHANEISLVRNDAVVRPRRFAWNHAWVDSIRNMPALRALT